MQEKQLHETPIMHKYRFFKEMHYGQKRELDEYRRLRPDYWEMREDVQKEVQEIMERVTSENFKELIAFELFKKEFLQLNGFEIDEVEYQQDIDLEHLKALQP